MAGWDDSQVRRQTGEIAASLGQGTGTPLRRKLSQLVELGLIETERDFDEPRNRAIRYRIADPALRFYYGLILPNESAIASSGAATVWSERLSERAFPGYVGREVFEDVVRQSYLRHRAERGLPAVDVWGRWSGKDRDRMDIEIDAVARLLDRRILTGSVKFRRRRAGATVFVDHVDALERLAASGRTWAHEALRPSAPMLFVSAMGFEDSFFDVAEASGRSYIAWDVEDLF